MDCRHVEFSPTKSEERIKGALHVFPKRLLMRLLAFTLHLLGVRRQVVAALVGMPEESVKTVVRLAMRDGFPALRDRRRSEGSPVARASPSAPRIAARREGEWYVVEFGPNGKSLKIPVTFRVQARTVLLSLVNAGLLSVQETATALGIHAAHCRELARKLASRDVVESLVDKRQGQKQDYLVGPQQKAEIIQQLAARAITGQSTSSDVLAEVVNERTQAGVSARTVRWHILKLGLTHIKETLPQLVEALKKKLLAVVLDVAVRLVPIRGRGSVAMLPNVSRRDAMVSLADSRVEVKAIALTLQCSVQTVHRWIRRSQTTGDLHDRPRSGRPALYSEEAKLRIVAFYCQTQPLPDCGRWSLRWATRHLEVDPTRIGVSPSKSTLHRILQSNRLKPHQSRYFLHITDPDFFPKMEHLVGLYRNPPRRLFFFDECPGIQVLKRLTPDLQTNAMRQRLEEFEYIRNGTLDVFAFLHHADGKVVLECHADHTAETFVEVFRRHVDRFPQAEPLHYVMDNLSTHRGYPFCQIVAELSGIVCPPEHDLSNQAKRTQWLCQEDKRIVIHFTPYHGSWLNLVEIWFGIMGAKVLSESFGAPEQLKAVLEAFADDWNLLLAHPFQWSYDGKGLHDKAVKRFTTMLRSSAAMMELRTLTKLLMLMTNLLKDYFSEVSEGSWHQLAASLSSQAEVIAALIQREEGPRRKIKAQRAFANLSAALQQRSLLTDDLAA